MNTDMYYFKYSLRSSHETFIGHSPEPEISFINKFLSSTSTESDSNILSIHKLRVNEYSKGSELETSFKYYASFILAFKEVYVSSIFKEYFDFAFKEGNNDIINLNEFLSLFMFKYYLNASKETNLKHKGLSPLVTKFKVNGFRVSLDIDGLTAEKVS